MEIFQLTLFFMLAFVVVIAFLVQRNRGSTIHVSFETQEYWVLCSRLRPNMKERLIAYLDEPGFTFGPYIWVTLETDEEGQIANIVQELEDF